MKIALIAPPYPLDQGPAPPLGICYVASACIQAGLEVKIFDYIVKEYTPEKFIAQLEAFQPDIVGATAVTMVFSVAAQIIKTAKTYNPSIITMMGGPHVSFDVQNTLTTCPQVDIIVVGEGEQTLKELLPVIKNPNEWSSIKGIAYKEKDKIIQTQTRDFIQDLDTLPVPDRDLLPMSRYLALGFPVSIITSRGCPNKCIFCLGRKMVGKKVRFRTASKIVDEIEYLLSLGCNRINIADDFFTANKRRVKLFCNEILQRGIKFDWSAFARVDSVDKASLEIMKKAGCDSVSFGIESGNKEMLKRVKKGISPDQARNAVKLCKEVGILAHASFMVGLPGETKETMADSHDLANELDIAYAYHFLAPFPGTVVRDQVENYDLEILTNDWNLYDADRPIVRTSKASPDDLNQFIDKFNNSVQQYIDDLERRYAKGQCTTKEIFSIEGRLQTKIIFKLLSNGIIENHGSYQTDIEIPASDQSLKLSQIISQVINMELGPIKRAIQSIHDAGFIKYSKRDKLTTWFWTDNNRVNFQ